MFHFCWIFLGTFVVALGEDCDDLVLSFRLGDFSGIAVWHPCDKDLGELIETGVVAQQGPELFYWTKL